MSQIFNPPASSSGTSPVFNVKDTAYGAKGDGETDDAAAIQAAITALPAGGGTIFFPTGVYVIKTGLTVTKPGVRFYGSGWDQETTTAGSCLKVEATITDAINVSSAASTFKLDTMWVNGNGKATNCITLESLNCSLRDAYFRRPATNGVGINVTSTGTSVWITNVRVNGANQAGSTGIRLNGTDSTLYGCKPVNLAVGIEYQNGASGGLCLGCHLTPGSTIGVNCIWVSAACANLGFAGNRIDNHGLGAGIQIDPSADFYGITLTGNVFYQNVLEDNKFPAIAVDTSTAMVYGLSVVGNEVRSASEHNYTALLGAVKRDGSAATNTGRLASYGTVVATNAVFAKNLYLAGQRPKESRNNSHSVDGTTWTSPDVMTLTAPQRAKFSIVSGQEPRESLPYYSAANNVAMGNGIMQGVLLPVVPGDKITNLGFIVGSTAATFGLASFHWWVALYDALGAALLTQSADQENAALSAGSSHLLALGAAYTVPAEVDAVLACFMVNLGTGGSPVTPTVRGATLNTAQVDSTTALFTTSRKSSITNGSGLGATAPAGPLTLTASGNMLYMAGN